MSIQGIFYTGVSGLMAQQVGMQVTGENIANVNTPGYSAETPVFETGITVDAGGLPVGSGVQTPQITRVYNDYLQTLLKNENSNNGTYTAANNYMQLVQPVFNELAGSGLGTSLSNFFNAFQNLALDPTGTAERESVLSQAGLLTDNFHQISTYLTNTQSQADASVSAITTQASSDLKSIAQLNQAISLAEAASPTGSQPNELLDQRELTVRNLAQLADISYSAQPDGTLTITLNGSGTTLVSGSQYATMYANTTGSANGMNDVWVTAVGNPPPATSGGAPDTDVTAAITTDGLGQLGGTLKFRDTTAQGFITNLNDLASYVVNSVNTVQTAGYGLTGNTNVNFFTPANTTAANISVSIANPDDIAAATNNPTAAGNGTGDNGNALALGALLTQNLAAATPYGTTSIKGFYNSLVADVGVQAQNASSGLTASNNMLTQLNTQRESQSGVSEDQELANMLNYQKAFQGSAKVISTATTMYDTILGLIS